MRTKKGLTLIELIVIIFIIGFLFFVSFPISKYLLGPRNKSLPISCNGKLKQWGLLYIMYCEDNNGSFSTGMTGSSSRDDWLVSLRFYDKGEIHLTCPMAKVKRTDGNDYGGPNNTYKISIKNENTKKIPLESSYGINCWLYNPPKDSNIVLTHPADNFWRTKDYSNASQIPLFADSMWIGGYPEPDGKAGEPPSVNGQWEGVEAEMKHFCIDRHSGAINMVFMDGHVEEVELKRLWKLKWHKNFDTNGKWTKSDAPWPKWMKDIKRK